MDHINGKDIRILSAETVNKVKDVCDANKLHQHGTRFDFGRIRTRGLSHGILADRRLRSRVEFCEERLPGAVRCRLG